MQRRRVHLDDDAYVSSATFRMCMQWIISNTKKERKRVSFSNSCSKSHCKTWTLISAIRCNDKSLRDIRNQTTAVWRETRRERSTFSISLIRIDFLHLEFMIQDICDLMTLWVNARYLKSKQKMRNLNLCEKRNWRRNERRKYLSLQIEVSTTIFRMIDESNDKRESDLSVCQNY